MVDVNALAPQIAQAKAAGYSDDDIVKHLSQGIPEIKSATDAGYKSNEILGHLSPTTEGRPRVLITTPPSEPPDDHGLAERQKLSPLGKAVSPITGYWDTYNKMNLEAQHQVGQGVDQLAAGFGEGVGAEPGSLAGLAKFGKGAANVGLGALGYLFSPISAGYRSIAGQPIEDVTGIPREQTEFALQLATPGLGFSKLPKAPGVAPEVPLIRPPPEIQRPVVAEAAQRLKEGGLADVPRAISGGQIAQRGGQYVSNVPIAGAPVSEAVHVALPQQLERARDVIAAEHGAGTGENVADRIRQTLREGSATETQAATDAAAQADATAAAEWQRANQEREAAIAAREQQSTQATQQGVGPDVVPQDMGETVIGHVRAAHNAAETNRNNLYREAGSHEGTVSDQAVVNANSHIAADLRSDGGQGTVTITPTLTPAAAEMRASMQAFSQRARQRIGQAQAEVQAAATKAGRSLTPEEIASEADQTGINLRTLETQRQELGNMAQGATNDADRRAARRIMNAFDDWHETAIEKNFDGDPGALDAYRAARAANRDFRTRFGYNARDDADKLINKIVRGEEDQHTGPVGVSNALTAGGDKSGPLFSRVMEATQGHPDVAQAIRSGTWNRLSREAPGTAEPRTLAEALTRARNTRLDIYSHLYGKGRDVAERVFSPEQRDLMQAHADTLLDTARQRMTAAEAADASTPVPTKVEPGPIQQLADRVIGGKKSDEALFSTIYGYAKRGGDVKTLARLVGQLPQEMRGDLAGSFIRNLGVSPGTKQFSLDHFATQWKNISDQAKFVMFGNAGPHVTALNDIATIAQQLKTVKARFGNPSGTTQNAAAIAAAAALFHSPITTILTGGGSYVAARILASPAGASSIAKYARALERVNRSPSIEAVTAAKLAQRNLENTARSLAAIQPNTR